MSLFATIRRDAPEAAKLVTLAHLASDFKDKFRSDPQKSLSILIYGYLTVEAASDEIKSDIERDLMNRSMVSFSKTLVQYGVPIDKIFVMQDFVYSSSKARKIDLFLEQQGESRHGYPQNPTDPHKVPALEIPEPARNKEISVNKDRQLVVEITAYKIESGKRTVVPELSLKTATGISLVDISKEFSAEVVALRPKLVSVLEKIGLGGQAEKVEFAIKIVGGGKISKKFKEQLSYEIGAQVQAALKIELTVPKIGKKLPVEISYSYGTAYGSEGFKAEGQGMIKVVLFEF
jgi:hypothetical protein